MGSNSVSIFGANPYIQRTTKNIFGVGSTIEALTDDIIVELLNVRAAATGNIAGVFNLGILTVPGAIVVDGVALNLLDRVLLQQQTNPVENGVYQVLENTGPSVLARTVDFQPNIRSSKVLVSEGTDLACSLWFNDKDPFLVLNVDPVKFVRDDGSGTGGGGNVTGIPPTVIGNLAVWVDNTATTIADSGLSVADILAALNQIVDVVLTGTNFSSVSTETNGSFVVLVKNLVADGPSAVFSITKNDPAAFPSIQTLSITPGTGSGELLELRWDPGMDLELRKTGLNYDGVYQVTLAGAGATTGGGDVTNATNVGGFNEVFKQKTGTILEFRTLEPGAGISITQNPDTLLITNTGGGGSAGRIAFNVAAIEILVNSVILIDVAYLAWDQSEYSGLTDGRVTFFAEIGDQEATIQLFDTTGAVVLGSLTTAGSGAYTFPLALPVADSRLVLQVQNDGLGVVDPQLFGTTISFQQAGGGGGLGQIAFVIAAIEILVTDPVFTELSYFAWDQSEYSGFTNGTITFQVDITGRDLDLQLRQVAGPVLTAIPTIVASGVYTFPVVLPVIDSRLVLEGFSSGVGADPMLFGVTLRFDQ